MPEATARMPDALPVLSRGKHRSPRKGGCFMEFASFMAGERWSDHPKCTHPVLASLARDVNDHLSDDARSRIVTLIPTVIGLVGDDPLIDLTIAVHSATAALPVAAYERQKSLAVGLLRCERELARQPIPAAAARELSAHIRLALAHNPEAERWARSFAEQSWGTVHDFSRTAQQIVSLSVSGIANACVADPDDRLRLLFERCLSDVEQLVSTQPSRRETSVRPSPERLPTPAP